MSKAYKFLAIIALVLFVVSMVSCGGGGGGNGGSPVPIITTSGTIDSNGGNLTLSDGTAVTFDPGVLKDGTSVTISTTKEPMSPLPSEIEALSSVNRIEFSTSALQETYSSDAGILIEIPTQSAVINRLKISSASLPDTYRLVRVSISNGVNTIMTYAKYVVNHGKATVKLMKRDIDTIAKYGEGDTIIEGIVISAIRCFSGAQLDNLYQVNSPTTFSNTIVTDPTKIPLILVHGYQIGPDECTEQYKTTWKTFLSYFFNDNELKNKYQVFSFSYNTAHSIKSSGEILAKKISTSFGNRPVVVLAYSMGGLVARSALVNSGANIQGLITLGTPHHGTPLVDIADSVEEVAGHIFSTAMEGGFFYSIPIAGRDNLAWDGFDGWSGSKGNNFLVELNHNDTYLSRYITYAGVTSKAPFNVSAKASYYQDSYQATISWDYPSSVANTYNIYWSNTPDVTKSNGTRIEGVSSPFDIYIHKNLVKENPYYYVVTAVNHYGIEGPESLEVSVTPPSLSSTPAIRESTTASVLLELGSGYENDTVVPEVSARFQDYDSDTGQYLDKPSLRRPPRSYLNIGHKTLHEDYVYLDQTGNPIFLNKIFPDIKYDLLGFIAAGTISGSVKDAVTQSPLQGVSINVYSGSLIVSTGTTDSNGTYSLSVPAGSGYSIEFSKSGYIPANYYNITVEADTTTYLEAVLQIDTAHSGTGNVSGKIVNALDGTGVSGLTINLRSGVNVTTGLIVAATTTQSDGSYSFTNLAAGNYTAEVSGSGYNTTYFTVVCIGGTTTANQDATITPILSSGETRIILTWGATPSDLDSHLTGPLPDGTRFHMYYWYAELCPDWSGCEGSPWPNYVKLDIDDIYSYGPETTTIYQQIDGVYRFSVHDYTNRDSSSSYDLSNSGAQVRVYRGSTLVATFNVPSNQGGTLWTVFELNGNTITPINLMSYESSPSNIQSVSGNSITSDAELIRNLPSKR